MSLFGFFGKKKKSNEDGSESPSHQSANNTSYDNANNNNNSSMFGLNTSTSTYINTSTNYSNSSYTGGSGVLNASTSSMSSTSSSLSSSTNNTINNNNNNNNNMNYSNSFGMGSNYLIQQVDNTQPTLNEIQILSAHSEAVKTLLKIDDDRLASSGDDYSIYIWSIETGQLLLHLKGHTNRITCLMYYQNNILISGSMDRSIRMWDLSSGSSSAKRRYDDDNKCYYIEPFKVLNKHTKSVKFLEKIPDGFCSASNDEDLFIWKEDGELERTITRISNDHINGILCVNNYILTAGSTSPYLVAYKLGASVPAIQLSGHNGCVNCLMRISDKHFVTGGRPNEDGLSSLLVTGGKPTTESPRTKASNSTKQTGSNANNSAVDKTIIIWNTHDFSQVASVSCDKAISYLYKITDNYILATIFKGFSIFDLHGNLILEYVPEEPDITTEINGAISLYDNTKLISWADVRLSVWNWNLKEIEQQLQHQSLSGSKKKSILKPQLIGEMRGHTDYINCLTVLDDHSIATGSSDKNIILWKDGKYQSSIRNHLAGVSLFESQPKPIDPLSDLFLEEDFKYEEREMSFM